MRRLLMLSTILLLPACADKQAIVMTPPAACSKLIPSGWKAGVEAAPVPQNTPLADFLGKPLTQAMAAAIVAPWATGYLLSDAQLTKANGRTSDTIEITEHCEALANAARPH